MLTPEDLLVRLCAAVPPPRFHMVRYFGVLSSHSAFRSRVVPESPEDTTAHRPPPSLLPPLACQRGALSRGFPCG